MKRCLIAALVAILAVVAIGHESAVAKEPKKARKTVEDKFNDLDADGSGELSVDEFCGKKKGSARKRMEKVFKKYDADESESLSLEEYKAKGKKKKKKKAKKDE